MTNAFVLPKPKIAPPLDPGFRPAVLANRAFKEQVAAAADNAPLILGLERSEGRSVYATRVLPDEHPLAAANLAYAERLLKFLLWKHGAWRVYVGGPRSIGEHLNSCYGTSGIRAFDARFMGEHVYGKPFVVVPCEATEVPDARENAESLGRHLDGCRIGFDLGASDRKVSAVIDGASVFDSEVVWEPRKHSDPAYHYREIMAGIQAAAAHLPRVDAIGGSAAGIYIENRVRAASLFRGVPKNRFTEVRDLFLRIQEQMGVPLEVVNDGEVTALAGSMSLNVGAILGIALGSSQAGGYVTREGAITGWLNELAFCPIDYSPEAPVDEWSCDRGVGALYLSQQCVFRLAKRAGVSLSDAGSDAGRLGQVQEQLAAGHAGAEGIWRTMGVYLGYAIAHYADFYDLDHVLVLGRCTSGPGGPILIEEARRVIETEFPALAGRLACHLPDEATRRVGQAIAAASLPALRKA